jgi:HAD superfamily hydrolase (TIGR01662 family)
MKTDLSPISVVFFDLGLTLINFEGDFYEVMSQSYLALAHSLINSGAQIDALEFAIKYGEIISTYYRTRDIDLIEHPLEDYLHQTLRFFDQDRLSDSSLQEAIENMFRVTEANWRVEPDAHETLRTLRSNGYKLGLISNAARLQDVNNLIDDHNLRGYFDCIVVSAQEGVRKPDSRIFNTALALMDIKPEHAVMVGDTLTADVIGAQQAGMHSIWITRRSERPENGVSNRNVKPDAVIESLDALIPVLASWQSKTSR